MKLGKRGSPYIKDKKWEVNHTAIDKVLSIIHLCTHFLVSYCGRTDKLVLEKASESLEIAAELWIVQLSETIDAYANKSQ